MAETDSKDDVKVPAVSTEVEETEATEDTKTESKTETRKIGEKEGKSTADDEPSPKKQKLDAKPAPITAAAAGEKTKEGEEEEEVKAYEIDEPPENPSTDDERIDSPSVVLFGLHPLVKEAPLSKLLETFGVLKSCSVRMAFASRYSSVEFETTDQAKAAYRALNNAKVMGKPIMVQPTVSKKS